MVAKYVKQIIPVYKGVCTDEAPAISVNRTKSFAVLGIKFPTDGCNRRWEALFTLAHIDYASRHVLI